MNNPSKSSKISLHVPPAMWHQFRETMLKARTKNEEVIGFFFCKRHKISQRQIRYLPETWVVPTPDCYEHQSASGIVLKQPFHLYLLQTYVQQGLDVVHVHTHPGKSAPHFSSIDDRYESEYAQFLSSALKRKPRLISGIFEESLHQPNFRIWNQKGSGFKPVNFYRSWFEIAKSDVAEAATEPMFDRQSVFGKRFQKQLGELTVTLIGCGGIGAIFAELLGRLGVKKWVLIDGDRLESANLNRMPGATWEMADRQLYKVNYVKQLIKQIYQTGASIRAIPANIEHQIAQNEIGASDLIVVATDNHSSRQIAQELALKYMRPLVSLGTHIDIKPNGVPRMYCRVTVPPLGGGWCLMCGNIINLQRSALESAPPEIEQLAARVGYIEGINDPAVFWLNSICASTGVGIIQGMVSGFLKVDSGLDWIYEFPESKWHKIEGDCLTTPDCYFCG